MFSRFGFTNQPTFTGSISIFAVLLFRTKVLGRLPRCEGSLFFKLFCDYKSDADCLLIPMATFVLPIPFFVLEISFTGASCVILFYYKLLVFEWIFMNAISRCVVEFVNKIVSG